MDQKDFRLVYSSDPAMNRKCAQCKELLSECRCLPEEAATDYRGPAYLRLETKGRGGKTVTVVAKLPRNETYLKTLTANLKKRCGAGGTYQCTVKEGVIEIQGDKKEAIRLILEGEGIKTKG